MHALLIAAVLGCSPYGYGGYQSLYDLPYPYGVPFYPPYYGFYNAYSPILIAPHRHPHAGSYPIKHYQPHHYGEG